ncbi:N-acetylneuraminate synthase [Leptospira sp. FAT2]|uniref:N-acetylneuraminate synthase n=1 Tax=Leptospira sanjuanensis TaxID=2879643 RepID=UPI001EE806EB|nr:N-acetylneuraminate synthase [Leptospira sanjuanensis]MCG6167598.1 N-acetylneuraminate synthase [Leptospira sanjuanensis]MCG6193017.1 N-acetylneuraminate synthase [Leptospira sanjuanensis]
MNIDYLDLTRYNSLSRQRSYIIAEIGVNHNGDLKLAKDLILKAKEGGADAVKFQTFVAENLASHGTPKVAYQKRLTEERESHIEMLKKLELKKEYYPELMSLCDQFGIDFLSTPYDVESAVFLKSLGIRVFKTASADIVDMNLHKYLASTRDIVIISTGMASLGEIEEVLDIYRKAGNERLILLHCVANYPCSDSSLNLRVLDTLKTAFGYIVGFSDHSEGIVASILSLGFGARVFEKHFTIDKNLPGPDHKASMDPGELKEYVNSIRRAERMLGSFEKICQEEEREMASVSRKSIVVNHNIAKGDIFAEENLTLKRPGSGIKPNQIFNILGKKASRDLERDHILRLADIEFDV